MIDQWPKVSEHNVFCKPGRSPRPCSGWSSLNCLGPTCTRVHWENTLTHCTRQKQKTCQCSSTVHFLNFLQLHWFWPRVVATQSGQLLAGQSASGCTKKVSRIIHQMRKLRNPRWISARKSNNTTSTIHKASTFPWNPTWRNILWKFEAETFLPLGAG